MIAEVLKLTGFDGIRRTSDAAYVKAVQAVFQIPGREVLRARRKGRAKALEHLADDIQFVGEEEARFYRITRCREMDHESNVLLEMAFLIAYTQEYYSSGPENEGVFPYVED